MSKGFTHARLACGCRVAFREGLARVPEPSDPLEFVKSQMYEPKYATYVAD